MKAIIFRFLLIFTCSLFHLLTFSQNVGINTITPLGKLHIKGSNDISQLIIDANSTQSNVNPLIRLRNSAGSDVIWIHSDDTTNTFVGLKAGRVNVVNPQGINNTFIGSRAGYSNTNGRDNTAIGTNALFSNTKGSINTAIGTNALYTMSYNPNGVWWQGNNVAVGFEALFSNQPTNTSNGKDNTAIGTYALYANSTGSQNTANGTSALFTNTTGSQNTAGGFQALLFNTKGSNNTANGNMALFSNTTANGNTAIGNKALFTQSYANNGTAWESANVAVGFEALYSNQPNNTSFGVKNTATGYSALRSNTTGHHNTAVGYNAIFSNTSGTVNTAIGVEALYSNTSGNFNVAIGNITLWNNITGGFNIAVGGGALSSNSSGGHNTAVGNNALSYLVGGNVNTAIGPFSGTASSAPNAYNTISIGNDGYLNAANSQAFLGNLSTAWNGGNVTWSTYSDARVKNNVREDVAGLDFITRLRPVTYYRSIKAMREITGNKETEDYPGKYDIEKVKFTGFLAQEVEQAALQSNYDFSGITIPKNSQELYTLSYEQFVVPLVKGMQEQQAMIDSQQKLIDALLRRIEILENKKS